MRYLHRVNRWAQGFAAVEKEEGEDAELRLGLTYVLPMLIDTEAWVNQDGDVELGLETDIQLSKRLRLNLSWQTEAEESFIGVEYRVNEYIALEWQNRDDVGNVLGLKFYF